LIDILPDYVVRELQDHLRERSAQAQAGWESAAEEEDALTGDFCGSLRRDWVEVNGDRGRWFWRVKYKKFRGRGKAAPEKHLGADGIFEIEARPIDGDIVTKGVLFQAKKERGGSRRDLRDQVRKMERIAPGGSAVFEFGPEAYRAEASAAMFPATQESNRIPHPRHFIGRYLADQFLPCRSGIRGMYYDAVRHNLAVPVAGTIRIVNMAFAHRVRVEAVHSSRFSDFVGGEE
jgi:hypothetical protein